MRKLYTKCGIDVKAAREAIEKHRKDGLEQPNNAEMAVEQMDLDVHEVCPITNEVRS